MQRMLWIPASLPKLAAGCLAQAPISDARLSNTHPSGACDRSFSVVWYLTLEADLSY
jgi:hypothetical protein